MPDSPTDRGSDALLSIAEGLDLVLISDDEVLVQFGTRSHPSELLRDSDLTGILGRTIGRLLQGPATFAELLSELPPKSHGEARTLIDDLMQRGILANVLTNPVDQYLRFTLTGEARLADRSVSLIGTGPVGVRIAYSLLQHGLGRIGLLDDRKADRLWYQFLPLDSEPIRDTARPVHALLRDRLIKAGYTCVDVFDAQLDAAGVESAVAASDFIVVALEQPHLRLAHMVNRFCIRDRKPWLLVTIDGNLGLIGPLFLPPHTACYNDYQVLVDAAAPTPQMSRKHRQHILRRGAGSFFPGLPAYADIVAGYASLGIVNFLLRDTSFVLGRVVVIDFDHLLIDVEDVLKLPRCPVCGIMKSAYRPAFPADIVASPQE